MTLPIITGPLRYLIGGDDSILFKPGRVYELSYDANRGDTRYGNLRDEKGRFDNLKQANREGLFAPYLPPDDITGDYGEFTPNPMGQGFLRNVTLQCAKASTYQAIRIELDNPDSKGLGLGAVLLAHDVAWKMGLHTIAKNPLLVSDPVRYLSHPSVDLAIVEHGAGGSDQMDALRRKVGQPLLAVRFVAFVNGGGEDGTRWANAVAHEIKASGYVNMSVTISRYGEYTDVHDILLPTDPAGGIMDIDSDIAD